MKKIVLPVFLISFIQVTAQTNYALSFDGSTNYVQVSDNNGLDLSANFTLEFWVYPTGVGSDPTQGGIIINKENSYEIARFADGSIQFAMSTSGLGSEWSWTNTGLTMPLNQWSHVALIKSGTSIVAYLNGSASYSDNAQPATLTGNSQALRIGSRDPSRNQFFNGYIDEVRIWNVARTQAQVKRCMFNEDVSNSATGLVGYYRMNEGSGSSTANSCTNTSGIDGSLVNSPSWQSSPIEFNGNALNFDGSDDYVAVPHVVSSDFTIEYWMKTTATGPSGSQWYNGDGIVDAEVGGVTNDWGTSLVQTKLAFGIGNSDITIKSTSDVNTGNWVHIAVTWKQSTGAMILYVNAVQENSTTGSTNLRNAPTRITFGEIQTNLNRFNGSLDEVRIWNVVRTQTQIQTDMNTEVDPTAESNLVAYYKFDQGITNGTNTGLVTLPDMKGNNNGTLNNFSLSGSSSNFVTQNSNLTVLPLQWLSFTAQAENKQAVLNWSTSQEKNTSQFIIQRSGNGVDWTSIGSVTAAGNSNNITNYSYVDIHPLAGANFYRIQEKDLDNRSTYSEVRKLRFDLLNSTFIILNNPVQDGVLKVQLNQPALLSLYDYKGSLLWQKQSVPGSVTIDLNKYARSMYILKAGGQAEKILKQ